MACGESGCVIVFSSDICKRIFAKSEHIEINKHIHTYSGTKGEREREKRDRVGAFKNGNSWSGIINGEWERQLKRC